MMGPYLLRCVAGVELLACADCELDRRVQESRCDEKETELGRGHMKAKIVQSTPLKKKRPCKGGTTAVMLCSFHFSLCF